MVNFEELNLQASLNAIEGILSTYGRLQMNAHHGALIEQSFLAVASFAAGTFSGGSRLFEAEISALIALTGLIAVSPTFRQSSIIEIRKIHHRPWNPHWKIMESLFASSFHRSRRDILQAQIRRSSYTYDSTYITLDLLSVADQLISLNPRTSSSLFSPFRQPPSPGPLFSLAPSSLTTTVSSPV
jgi:hypothetical protein